MKRNIMDRLSCSYFRNFVQERAPRSSLFFLFTGSFHLWFGCKQWTLAVQTRSEPLASIYLTRLRIPTILKTVFGYFTRFTMCDRLHGSILAVIILYVRGSWFRRTRRSSIFSVSFIVIREIHAYFSDHRCMYNMVLLQVLYSVLQLLVFAFYSRTSFRIVL